MEIQKDLMLQVPFELDLSKNVKKLETKLSQLNPKTQIVEKRKMFIGGYRHLVIDSRGIDGVAYLQYFEKQQESPQEEEITMTRKVLEKIELDDIWFIGYAFQIEMKYSTLRSGFKIKEVPVTFTDRVLGQSKMDMSIFKEAFLGVMKLRGKKF